MNHGLDSATMRAMAALALVLASLPTVQGQLVPIGPSSGPAPSLPLNVQSVGVGMLPDPQAAIPCAATTFDFPFKKELCPEGDAQTASGLVVDVLEGPQGST